MVKFNFQLLYQKTFSNYRLRCNFISSENLQINLLINGVNQYRDTNSLITCRSQLIRHRKQNKAKEKRSSFPLHSYIAHLSDMQRPLLSLKTNTRACAIVFHASRSRRDGPCRPQEPRNLSASWFSCSQLSCISPITNYTFAENQPQESSDLTEIDRNISPNLCFISESEKENLRCFFCGGVFCLLRFTGVVDIPSGGEITHHVDHRMLLSLCKW